MKNTLEKHMAGVLVSIAIEMVERTTVDAGDLDAATIALLARALEFARGKQLKDLHEIFI